MKLFGTEDINSLYKNNELDTNGGYFPVGSNGLWHSGIHIKTDKAIFPCLEGKIIAYKICEKYDCIEDKIKTIENRKVVTKDSKEYNSSAFVLLHHTVDIIQDSKNSKKSNKLDFFTMHMSLLPDCEYDTVKTFSNDFIELNKKIDEQIPFYHDWKFKINQEKAISYYNYNNNNEIFENSTGYIKDDDFLNKNNPSSLKCIMTNNPNKTISIELKYMNLDTDNNKLTIHGKSNLKNIKFYPCDITKVDSSLSRGTIHNKDYLCEKDIVTIDGTKFLKIYGKGTTLSHNEHNGYVFYSNIKQTNNTSNYAYVNNDIVGTKAYMYNIEKITSNTQDFYMLCTYKEYLECKNKISGLSAIKLVFTDWNVLLNQKHFIADMDANFKDDSEKKAEPSPETNVIICNLNYSEWIRKDTIPKEAKTYYDIAYDGEINQPLFSYVENDLFSAIKKYIENKQNKIQKQLTLCKIIPNNEYVKSPENMELKKDDILLFISGQNLVMAKSRLRENETNPWLVKVSDMSLIKGPVFSMKKYSKELPLYKMSKNKGILMYENPNGNPKKLLTESDGEFSIINSFDFLTNDNCSNYIEIKKDNEKYYIKPETKHQLKAKLIYKEGFKKNKTITLSENDEIYVNTNTCLGYGSEYSFSEIKQKKMHDFVLFTKDTKYTQNKDEKLIRSVKAGTKALIVTKNESYKRQLFPNKTVFSIKEEKEILGHKYLCIKLETIPMFFSLTQAALNKDGTYTTKDVDRVWFYYTKVDSKGNVIVAEDSKNKHPCYTGENSSVFINIVKEHYNILSNHTYKVAQENCFNSDKSCVKLAVDYSCFNKEFYILSTENFIKDKQRLILNDSTKEVLIYFEEPYSVKESTMEYDEEFDSDDGAILKYKFPTGAEESYVSVKDNNVSKFVKKSDVKSVDILNWQEFFQILDKSPSNDVICDLEDEIINQLELSDEDKQLVLDSIKETDSIKQVLNTQKPQELVNLLRRLMVKHPLEWNVDLFPEDSDFEMKLDCDNYSHLRKQMETVSVWNEISSVLDNQKELIFSHPLYYLNHLEKIKENTAKFLIEKWGSRITGRTGNVYILDNGKGKLLSNVEWYDQRDNKTNYGKGEDHVDGDVMCQLTSLAMVMNALGIQRKQAAGDFEDELFDIVKVNYANFTGRQLWTQTRKVYETILPQYTDKYEIIFPKNDFISEAKKQIDKENPVLLSMIYKGGGHVIVAVGYTESGLIINDPYGNRTTGSESKYCTDKNGAFVEYPTDKWDISNRWVAYLLKE
ncbi:MAG: C39 family peptidase [Lachnospiraceae bacterium]|nr:C39 family peptidase [Lachnospiraceae bacterium]